MDKYDRYMDILLRLFIALMVIVIIVALSMYREPKSKSVRTLRNEIVNVPMRYEEAGEI